jgi:hypothetical protein
MGFYGEFPHTFGLHFLAYHRHFSHQHLACEQGAEVLKPHNCAEEMIWLVLMLV